MSIVKPLFVASIASLTLMMTSITSIVQLLQHRLLCMSAQKKLTRKIGGEGDESSTDLATSGKGGVADVPLP